MNELVEIRGRKLVASNRGRPLSERIASQDASWRNAQRL
jgi:hypothetical protein